MTSDHRSRPSPRRTGSLVSRGRRPREAIPFDRLDEAILRAFQSDGRASLRQIAREVGASVTTVSSRVHSLERLGVLQGFVPLLSVQRLAAIGRSPQCTVLRILPERSEAEHADRLARRIAQVPSICYLFELCGSEELMALASTGSPRETDALLRALRRIPGVSRVRPTSILRVHKERPNHPVGAAPASGMHPRDEPVTA